MSEELKAELRRLREQEADARMRGREDLEAAFAEERATVHAALSQFEEAKKCLTHARGLHEAAGRADRVARMIYGLGLLDARHSDPGRARRQFEDVVTRFEATGDWAMVGRTHIHLATLAMDREDLDAADGHLEMSGHAFGVADDTAGVVQAFRGRALLLQARGMPDEAMRVLTDAAEAAEGAGEVGQLLSVRMDLLGLSAGVEGAVPEAELEAFLRDATAANDRAAIGHALLARAGAREAAGRYDEALADAEAVRQIALEIVDPITYTISCLLIAEINDRLGNKVAVLTILFTCQASLATLLGDEARDPVLVLLDSVRRRWGEDEYQAALAEYRKQFDETPA